MTRQYCFRGLVTRRRRLQFAHSTAHTGLGSVYDIKVCALGSAEFKSNRHGFKRNRTNPNLKGYQMPCPFKMSLWCLSTTKGHWWTLHTLVVFRRVQTSTMAFLFLWVRFSIGDEYSLSGGQRTEKKIKHLCHFLSEKLRCIPSQSSCPLLSYMTP